MRKAITDFKEMRVKSEGATHPLWQRIAVPFAIFSAFSWLIFRVLRRMYGFVDGGVLPRARYSDFFEFYSAAVALIKGTDIYTAGALGYIYPPLLALLMTPLAMLPIAQAAWIWLIAKTSILALCGWLGAKEIQQRFSQPTDWMSISIVFLLAMLMDIDKLLGEMAMQQSNLLVLLCFVLALRWLDRHPLLSGLALGFGANIKYVTLVALPYLLLRKRFRAAAATVAASVFWALLPALFVGWGRNMDMLRKAIGGLSNLSSSDSAAGSAKVFGPGWGISIPAFAVRFFGTGGQSHTALSVAVVCAVALLFCFAAWGIYRASGIPLLRGRGGHIEMQGIMPGAVAIEWAGLIIITLVFSPQTSSPRLSMLLLPCIVAVSVLFLPQKKISGSPLILGLLIMFAGMILPIKNAGFAKASPLWNNLSGVMWCIMIMYLTLLWTGLRRLKAQTELEEVASAEAIRSHSQCAARLYQKGDDCPESIK